MNLYDELRGAIEAALEHLESSGVGEDTYDYLNEHVGTDGDCPLVKLHKRLKNALALPRRNCDVGTAEEQKKRLDAYCEERQCINCPHVGGSKDESGACGLGWAQMPETEGGAE